MEINREILANNLKLVLNKLKIPVNELAHKIGATRHQIDSILYKRGYSEQILKSIAKLLDISIEQLCSQNLELILYKNFDVELHLNILSAINKVLAFYQLKITKVSLDNIANSLYTHYNEIKNLEEAIKGIIFYLYKDTMQAANS
ncbi:hypothetical protein MIDIC_10022 [Alphaproteobacteria bacterium]